MKSILVAALMTVSAVGCTSFRTSIANRLPDGTFCPQTPKTKGLPVKLKVPAYVRATIKEDFFIETVTQHNPCKVVSKDECGKEILDNMQKPIYIDKEHPVISREISLTKTESGTPSSPIRSLRVETEVVYEEKVFTVDFKRPIAGELSLSAISFDQDQYFQKITAAYTEKTIQDINASIGFFNPVAKKSTDDTLPGIAVKERVVAVSQFDISNPCWEAELNKFVSQHITDCHPARCKIITPSPASLEQPAAFIER